MEKAKRWIIPLAGIGVLFLALQLGAGLSIAPKANYAEWMKAVDDDAPITSLSIPGTHDSGATCSVAEVAGICQDLSIGDQLTLGARFLDIRLKGVNDVLQVYHGFIKQNLAFSEVLKQCYAFLDAHPSETILFSVKKEENPDNCTKGFEELLKGEIDGKRFILNGLPSRLGDARGKIILLSRYADATIGLPSYDGWQDPGRADAPNTFDYACGSLNVHVQDHYQLLDAETKWGEALAAIDYASSHPDELTLNFFSGYLMDYFPPSYSVSVARSINPKIQSELPVNHSGVLIVDFYGEALANAMLGGKK